ncbi:MAG: rRNA methyltransferase, partial [Proteobacteria bacterium]
MINLNVFSEEKAWSKKLKKKDFFFKFFCDVFQ